MLTDPKSQRWFYFSVRMEYFGLKQCVLKGCGACVSGAVRLAVKVQGRSFMGGFITQPVASFQLLATSSALSVASKVPSSPPRARQIFTVRSLEDRKRGCWTCVEPDVSTNIYLPFDMVNLYWWPLEALQPKFYVTPTKKKIPHRPQYKLEHPLNRWLDGSNQNNGLILDLPQH